MDKPICGGAGPDSTVLKRIIELFGIGTGLVSAGTAIVKLLTDTAVILGISIGIWAGALVGAFLGCLFVYSYIYDRLSSRPGKSVCYSGVVNGIVESFNSGWDYVAPYTAQHDRVDVVVKPTYWVLVEASPQQWIWCASDRQGSPLIRSYFYSDEIEGAGIGSGIGAGIGAVGGIIAGVLIGAAIGCAGGPIICAIAIIVALLVALVCVIVGALIGGDIGKAAAGNEDPMATPASGGDEAAIGVGDYVTFRANLAIYPEDRSAWVAWWVDEDNSPPVLHGRSTSGEGSGGGAPFPFQDPRDNLTSDGCPVIKDSSPVP